MVSVVSLTSFTVDSTNTTEKGFSPLRMVEVIPVTRVTVGH